MCSIYISIRHDNNFSISYLMICDLESFRINRPISRPKERIAHCYNFCIFLDLCKSSFLSIIESGLETKTLLQFVGTIVDGIVSLLLGIFLSCVCCILGCLLGVVYCILTSLLGTLNSCVSCINGLIYSGLTCLLHATYC